MFASSFDLKRKNNAVNMLISYRREGKAHVFHALAGKSRTKIKFLS